MKKYDIFCKCGCGEKLEWKYWFKPSLLPEYKLNHAKQRMGKIKKESKNRNTLYSRQRRSKRTKSGCFFHAQGKCKGRTEAHHIDKDITNENKSNLINLCQSHHKLTHSGKFDLKREVDFVLSNLYNKEKEG
jgi:hypothetical protein